MRKKFLLTLLAGSILLPIYAQVRLQLLTQQEQLETAQTLGKMVFAGDKLLVYDLQDNLILETGLSTDLVMLINAEDHNVTLRPNSSEEVNYDVNTAIDNTLVFNGVPAGAKIRIYTMNGVLVKQTVATEQTTTLPMDDMPAGTYVLQINNTILKLLKQ